MKAAAVEGRIWPPARAILPNAEHLARTARGPTLIAPLGRKTAARAGEERRGHLRAMPPEIVAVIPMKEERRQAGLGATHGPRLNRVHDVIRVRGRAPPASGSVGMADVEIRAVADVLRVPVDMI